MIVDRNMWVRFKCFNVNFRLLKTIYVHLLVCYLNKLQNARYNDKDYTKAFIFTVSSESLNLLTFRWRKGFLERLIDIYNANSLKSLSFVSVNQRIQTAVNYCYRCYSEIKSHG